MRTICILGLIAGTTFSLLAQQISWTRKADLPIPLSKAKAVTIHGKVYVIGGVSPSVSGFSKSNYQYDPKTDTWTSRADIPVGRTNYAIAVVRDKIYLIGGDPFLNRVDIYDPATDKWYQGATMPTKRQHISCAVVDDKIYVIGGFENICCPPFPERCDWNTCADISGKNEVYNPVTDTWESLASMPTPRHGLDMASVHGKIYVIGGMGTEASIWEPLNTVESYDPKSNEWSKKENMPTPRDGYGYSVINNKIIVFGGWIDEKLQTTSVIVYDVRSNRWKDVTPLPVKTGACAYVALGEHIYFFGGDREDYKEIFTFAYEGMVIEML